MRTCKKCKLKKESNEFRINKVDIRGTLQRDHFCIPCRTELEKERAKLHRNSERIVNTFQKDSLLALYKFIKYVPKRIWDTINKSQGKKSIK